MIRGWHIVTNGLNFKVVRYRWWGLQQSGRVVTTVEQAKHQLAIAQGVKPEWWRVQTS